MGNSAKGSILKVLAPCELLNMLDQFISANLKDNITRCIFSQCLDFCLIVDICFSEGKCRRMFHSFVVGLRMYFVKTRERA